MYNLIEYSSKYSKTSGSLWQYYREDPSDPIAKSKSFKFKSRFLINTNNVDIVNLEIAVPFKHLSYFWRMPPTNWEVNLNLTWSANCVICEANSGL